MADLSDLLTLFRAIEAWLKLTTVSFGDMEASLWSIFVASATISTISFAFFGGDKNDD